jgi:acyl-CoA hydrolase
MVIGFCVLCNAQAVQTSQTSVKAAVAVVDEDGYKEVKFEELTPVVQEAIKANYANLQIKSLAYHAEKKLTKIVFVTPNGEEKVVILNEEGKEYKEQN